MLANIYSEVLTNEFGKRLHKRDDSQMLEAGDRADNQLTPLEPGANACPNNPGSDFTETLYEI